MVLNKKYLSQHPLAVGVILFVMLFDSSECAPAVEDGENEGGCYYMFNHYGEGDRILTNEPCLNCTCHNSMLMCYLRVCPFTKPIGQDCLVEKKPDQCCPVITCPQVPVSLVTPSQLISTTSTTTVATVPPSSLATSHRGCEMDGKFYNDGAQVASSLDKPCELCYCIRNHTACVMQECILHVEGCEPVFETGTCCPVRYNCDKPLSIETTTIGGFISTTISSLMMQTTPQTGGCYKDGEFYADGSQIVTPGEAPCEHCYCMRSEIVCAVQECGSPMEGAGENCTPVPPRSGLCCPEKYSCHGCRQDRQFPLKSNVTEGEGSTTPSTFTTLYPANDSMVEDRTKRPILDEIKFTTESLTSDITTITPVADFVPESSTHISTANETAQGTSVPEGVDLSDDHVSTLSPEGQVTDAGIGTTNEYGSTSTSTTMKSVDRESTDSNLVITTTTDEFTILPTLTSTEKPSMTPDLAQQTIDILTSSSTETAESASTLEPMAEASTMHIGLLTTREPSDEIEVSTQIDQSGSTEKSQEDKVTTSLPGKSPSTIEDKTSSPEDSITTESISHLTTSESPSKGAPPQSLMSTPSVPSEQFTSTESTEGETDVTSEFSTLTPDYTTTAEMIGGIKDKIQLLPSNQTKPDLDQPLHDDDKEGVVTSTESTGDTVEGFTPLVSTTYKPEEEFTPSGINKTSTSTVSSVSTTSTDSETTVGIKEITTQEQEIVTGAPIITSTQRVVIISTASPDQEDLTDKTTESSQFDDVTDDKTTHIMSQVSQAGQLSSTTTSEVVTSTEEPLSKITTQAPKETTLSPAEDRNDTVTSSEISGRPSEVTTTLSTKDIISSDSPIGQEESTTLPSDDRRTSTVSFETPILPIEATAATLPTKDMITTTEQDEIATTILPPPGKVSEVESKTTAPEMDSGSSSTEGGKTTTSAIEELRPTSVSPETTEEIETTTLISQVPGEISQVPEQFVTMKSTTTAEPFVGETTTAEEKEDITKAPPSGIEESTSAPVVTSKPEDVLSDDTVTSGDITSEITTSTRSPAEAVSTSTPLSISSSPVETTTRHPYDVPESTTVLVEVGETSPLSTDLPEVKDVTTLVPSGLPPIETKTTVAEKSPEDEFTTMVPILIHSTAVPETTSSIGESEPEPTTQSAPGVSDDFTTLSPITLTSQPVEKVTTTSPTDVRETTLSPISHLEDGTTSSLGDMTTEKETDDEIPRTSTAAPSASSTGETGITSVTSTSPSSIVKEPSDVTTSSPDEADTSQGDEESTKIPSETGTIGEREPTTLSSMASSTEKDNRTSTPSTIVEITSETATTQSSESPADVQVTPTVVSDSSDQDKESTTLSDIEEISTKKSSPASVSEEESSTVPLSKSPVPIEQTTLPSLTSPVEEDTPRPFDDSTSEKEKETSATEVPALNETSMGTTISDEHSTSKTVKPDDIIIPVEVQTIPTDIETTTLISPAIPAEQKDNTSAVMQDVPEEEQPTTLSATSSTVSTPSESDLISTTPETKGKTTPESTLVVTTETEGDVTTLSPGAVDDAGLGTTVPSIESASVAEQTPSSVSSAPTSPAAQEETTTTSLFLETSPGAPEISSSPASVVSTSTPKEDTTAKTTQSAAEDKIGDEDGKTTSKPISDTSETAGAVTDQPDVHDDVESDEGKSTSKATTLSPDQVISEKTTITSELSEKPTTPSELSDKTATPSELPQKSTTPSEPSDKTATPSELSEKPTTPSELSEKTTTPSDLSEKPTTQSELSEKMTIPSELSEKTTTPSELSEATATPSELSEKPTAPSEISDKTTTPSELSEKTTTPSEPSEKVTTPSELSEKTTIPSELSEKTTIPSELSGKTTTPSELSEKPTTQSELSEKTTTPSELSEKTTTPSELSEKPTTPSELSEKTTTPSELSEKPTTPSELSEKPTAPSEISDKTTTPSELSEKTTTPSELSEKPTTPSELSEKTTTPSELSEKTTTPSEFSEKTTTPSELSEKPTTPSELSEKTTTPSEFSEKTTTPSEVSEKTTAASELSEKTTTPSEVSENVTTPSELSEKTTTPSEVSEKPTTPSELSEATATPSEISEKPTAPSEISDKTTTLSELSEKTTTPSELSEKTTTPYVLPEKTTTPSELSDKTATPSELSEKTTTPSELSEKTTTPYVLPEKTTTPSELSEKTTTPYELPEKTTTPSELSDKTATPSELSEKMTTPSELSEKTTTPSELSEKMTTPSELSEKATTPSEISEKVTTPSELSEKTTISSEISEKVTTPSELSEKTTTPSELSEKTTTPSELSEPEIEPGVTSPATTSVSGVTSEKEPEVTTVSEETTRESGVTTLKPDIVHSTEPSALNATQGITDEIPQEVQTQTPKFPLEVESSSEESTQESITKPSSIIPEVSTEESTESSTQIFSSSTSEKPSSISAQVVSSEGTTEGYTTQPALSDDSVPETSTEHAVIIPIQEPDATPSSQQTTSESAGIITSEEPETQDPVKFKTTSIASSTTQSSQSVDGITAESSTEGFGETTEHITTLEQDIKLPPQEISTSKDFSDELPGVVTTTESVESTFGPLIPGEGSCFVDGITYRNGSHIPPSTSCQLACACQNSIVHCLLVHCPPPPAPGPATNFGDCKPIYTPNTCCPKYNCDVSDSTPSSIVTPDSGDGIPDHSVVTVTPEHTVTSPVTEQPSLPSVTEKVNVTESITVSPDEIESTEIPALNGTSPGKAQDRIKGNLTAPTTSTPAEIETTLRPLENATLVEASSLSPVASEQATSSESSSTESGPSKPQNETTFGPSQETPSSDEGKVDDKNVTITTTPKYPVSVTTTISPSPAPWPYPASTSGPGVSSGACLFDGRVYMSAQQIPRDDPCDFCFCFRGDIICLQQSCPPPIPGCYEEPIPGFCCPRYECPVGSSNSSTPPSPVYPPSYYHNQILNNLAQPSSLPSNSGVTGPGCEIQGEYYESGQLITSTSGPCLECRCGVTGMMECDPRECQPEPMLRKMIEDAITTSKR